MARSEDLTPGSAPRARSWHAQWAAVPVDWRRPVYRIDAAPASAVFLQNRYYTRTHRGLDEHDFSPLGAPPRFAEELAWWVWLCHCEGLRKIEPAVFKWAGQSLAAAAEEHHKTQGRSPSSITELSPAAVIRQAVLLFERRNARLPSPGTRRNIAGLIEHLCLHLSVRCTDTEWWAHDIWDLRADPRIPQREHEPGHDRSVKIGAIKTIWLREGVRFWLRTALDAELMRWSTAVDRARDMARHFAVFVTDRGDTEPALTPDPAELRLIFTAFTEYLRSPAAAAKPDKPLSPSAIDATRSQT